LEGGAKVSEEERLYFESLMEQRHEAHKEEHPEDFPE
jgi:hypothetical protein